MMAKGQWFQVTGEAVVTAHGLVWVPEGEDPLRVARKLTPAQSPNLGGMGEDGETWMTELDGEPRWTAAEPSEAGPHADEVA